MLQIRKEQKQALDKRIEKIFIDRLVQHCQQTWLVDSENPQELKALRSRVKRAVANAREFGLSTEFNIATFVNLTFSIGPRFPDTPQSLWARPLLQRSDLDENVKIANLLATKKKLSNEP